MPAPYSDEEFKRILDNLPTKVDWNRYIAVSVIVGSVVYLAVMMAVDWLLP